MAMTWEEKIAKAEETARKKAEKEGLDEAATQDMVNEAVAKVKTAWEKERAEEAESKKTGSWLVKVSNDPNYCGVGAGGVQFAYGQAVVKSERMARWFKEHPGYDVTEQ